MGLITSTNYCVHIFFYLKGLCISRPPALTLVQAPNLYLPALAPNLYLHALASNFYLLVLVSPDPGLAYINLVRPICITML